ncbi:RepB family plasmid replication initiator protein [Nissabacter sp. SGAir0207]|uniref:RepB family plasmid replication initiator protein n=1 Tax=Nissabacter sp. SGAir0207 TaxID=2126321 RepID=UPI0010CCF707|nr:RepB family plasmid replication initiator protein [Nissabacter sp. SGAir0207]QCR38717.1 protein RepA [Nissabacter sp. SGAir0207]
MEKNAENNELGNPFAVVRKESGTVYELVPNSHKTVQPVALLRLSVFTPVSPKNKGKRDFQIDASEELSSLEVARQEGYSNIKIQGAKLNMSTDFKTWIGIISAFSTYGFSSEKINLPFVEFAKLCGIKSVDIKARLRTRLHDSLFNISSLTLAFSSKDGQKSMITHLVHSAVLDIKNDTVEIIGDKRLWELYRYDHKVLLGLKALAELAKKEAAQSLYIYFESMPSGTLFISMKRLRERLAMESPVNVQNQIIRRALADLEKIGYLSYSETKKGREIQFIIFERHPKLKSLDIIE